MRSIESDARRRVAWILGSLALVHLVIGVINLTPLIDRYPIDRLLDVNFERTVVVWLSSATLLATAGVAGVGAVLDASRRLGWAITAGFFVLLSVDETATLHELVGEIAGRRLQIERLPGGYAWVVVVAPIAAVAAIVLLRWLGRVLGWRTVEGRMATLAIVLWLLVPFVESAAPTLGSPRQLIVAEESLEAAGEVLMFGALALYVFGRTGSLDLPSGRAGRILPETQEDP